MRRGKLKPTERKEAQRRFMADELKLMVTTNAFGLGIDKPDLRFVVHQSFRTASRLTIRIRMDREKGTVS